MERRPDGWTVLTKSDLEGCDYAIFNPIHYRDDGTCRCNDPNDPYMAEWGYQWSDTKNKWVASWEEV